MKELLEKAVKWNDPQKGIDGIPVLARECKDHSAVRSTSYMEIYQILGTSGCSKDDKMWDWAVMGIIDMEHGHLVVCPGDWIVEISEGHYMVFKDTKYQTLLKACAN